eukprot:Seg3324.1 transcript_id=Seg3324.1/GoldUCD/mRNA.D3Y31 product="hypothetical protein" protein_id=Seg3324.1/GoldUCD/D3Y31
MGDCRDSYSATQCPSWAARGECQKNKQWMWKNCCKSCKGQGRCQDYRGDCSRRVRAGQCDSPQRRTYMWRSCCVSCRSAWRNKNNCTDKNKKCRSWADRGYCRKSKTWMTKNCCKSCKKG